MTLILKINVIRLFNILFVTMGFIPLMVINAIKDNVKYSAYGDLVNKYSFIIYMITIFISIIMFKGGKIAGRKISVQNRKKELTDKKGSLIIASLVIVNVIVGMFF